MTIIDTTVFAGSDPIEAIAQDVFTAMVDGEEGHLLPWLGERPEPVVPVHAWVDVRGPVSGRILLTTERATAQALTRALLAIPADEPVEAADMVDALGEVANVVGGNIKSLVPEGGVLTLPQVESVRPEVAPGQLLHDVAFGWRGQLLVISLLSTETGSGR